MGCDLELMEPRSDAFVRTWFTDRERDAVFAAETTRERFLRANLFWSAKESALPRGPVRSGVRQPAPGDGLRLRPPPPPPRPRPEPVDRRAALAGSACPGDRPPRRTAGHGR
ncbi:4'-phosphopantetheinyl transferase family protein [Amycolatopsis sp. RTGN1]|uniref:4'-phosphopantetheinyl transferase family protein n=1 Tax=Amycolatopsis ponsaeliensis TaxID=2992142 RepID=UPI003306BB04